MKKIISFVLLFLISAAVFGAGDPDIKDIILSCDAPTVREDGSAITSIDHYNIYHSIDNVLQATLNVPDCGYELVDVAFGTHTFQIAAVELGLEGTISDPISEQIVQPPQSPIAKILITVEIVD